MAATILITNPPAFRNTKTIELFSKIKNNIAWSIGKLSANIFDENGKDTRKMLSAEYTFVFTKRNHENWKLQMMIFHEKWKLKFAFATKSFYHEEKIRIQTICLVTARFKSLLAQGLPCEYSLLMFDEKYFLKFQEKYSALYEAHAITLSSFYGVRKSAKSSN